MLHVEWYHICWPRLTAKRVEPVVSISWASCYSSIQQWDPGPKPWHPAGGMGDRVPQKLEHFLRYTASVMLHNVWGTCPPKSALSMLNSSVLQWHWRLELSVLCQWRESAGVGGLSLCSVCGAPSLTIYPICLLTGLADAGLHHCCLVAGWTDA